MEKFNAQWVARAARSVGHAAQPLFVGALLLTLASLTDNTASAQDDDLAADDESLGAVGPSIPEGQEALLAAMLGQGQVLAGNCKLAQAVVDYTLVNATYICSGDEVAAELAHVSQATSTATRTSKFAIDVAGGAAARELGNALVSLVRTHEGAFEWKFPEDEAALERDVPSPDETRW